MPDQTSTTLRALAIQLNTTVDMLTVAMREGYLHFCGTGKTVEETRVYLPPRHTLKWLEFMFRPLHRQPLIRMTEIAKMLDMSLASLKRYCREFEVKWEKSATFGDLMSPDEFELLLDQLPDIQNVRFDRISLLQYLCGERLGQSMRRRSIPYSVRLEREIARIAKLHEPQRTVQAAELWSAFQDARTVAEALREYRDNVGCREVEENALALEQLMDKLTATPPSLHID